jgi:hypothetical protein
MSYHPSVYELTSSEVLSPQLAAHVADCGYCQAIRAAWEADSHRDDDVALDVVVEVHWPHRAHADPDATPVPGAVHSVWGAEGGQLLVAVVLEVDDREALVLPVSDQLELAGDWDLLLDGDVLPFPAMVELWNHVRVLREQLLEQIGAVGDGLVDGLAQAFRGFMSGQPVPQGLRQGPPLVADADPRHRFRDLESERVRWFAEPWRVLYEADTFGGVVQGRRQERELELTVLSEDIDIPQASLERLEADREDLVARVSKPNLTKLIKRLQLPASGRLVDLVEDAAYSNASQPPPDMEMARARRRRGVRSVRPELPDEVRRQMAEQYVSGLLESLAEEQ